MLYVSSDTKAMYMLQSVHMSEYLSSVTSHYGNEFLLIYWIIEWKHNMATFGGRNKHYKRHLSFSQQIQYLTPEIREWDSFDGNAGQPS